MPRDLRKMFREAFELAETPDPEVEDVWAAEAERRWREIESGAVQTIPWEEVRSRLFRRG